MDRFLNENQAQISRALADFSKLQKNGHYIWFILPQLAGLGNSRDSERYGLAGLEEACAFLNHPILGANLWACHRTLLAAAESGEHSFEAGFASVDRMKLLSHLTLFELAASPADSQTIEKLRNGLFGGRLCLPTLRLRGC